LLLAPHLPFDPEQFLHMMPDFVRQYIRLGKFTRSAEFLTQLIIEPQVDVHFLITGAVERTRSRLGRAARRFSNVAEQNKFAWR